ncbi:MAG: NlpC/P60 family protein [Candidatus Aminicenantia bacterium]
MKNLFIFILTIAFTVFAIADEKFGVVKISVGNMHRNPDEMSEVVSQAIIGTNLKILKGENREKEEWFYVETPDTYKGWMKADSIRVYKEKENLYSSRGKVFEVASLIAYIYRERDVTKSSPLSFATISAVLEVGECGERWCEIILPGGERGWIHKGDGFVRKADEKRRLNVDEMIYQAMRFLGMPYLWGGKTPLGFDCSGFAQVIYKIAGIELLRDAYLQFEQNNLIKVEKGKEKKGDLVFFGKEGGRISHVGIMINEKEFINATTHEKPVVQISNLYDPYWQNIYRGARRATDFNQ